MAIAFLCNKDLTIPFEALARYMRDGGEEIAWLSPSTRWSKWLIGRGWAPEIILNLPDRRHEWASHARGGRAGYARALRMRPDGHRLEHHVACAAAWPASRAAMRWPILPSP